MFKDEIIKTHTRTHIRAYWLTTTNGRNNHTDNNKILCVFQKREYFRLHTCFHVNRNRYLRVDWRLICFLLCSFAHDYDPIVPTNVFNRNYNTHVKLLFSLSTPPIPMEDTKRLTDTYSHFVSKTIRSQMHFVNFFVFQTLDRWPSYRSRFRAVACAGRAR